MSGMPDLATERLLIRQLTLTDESTIHRILSLAFGHPEAMVDSAAQQERQRWLAWTVQNYDQLAQLHQPPYGERAIVLRATNELIGAVGYVPCLDFYSRLPSLIKETSRDLMTTEFGLFWAIAPEHQGQGYASEAAQAMIDHAFHEFKLKRVIATTEYTNSASQGVMRKLGMRVEQNMYADPPWLQVVGILDNPQNIRGQRLEIVPYQAEWPATFAALAGSLRQALGPLALRIDHIGSTSVPNLSAKDVIDIQVTVGAFDAALTSTLAPLGYTLHAGVMADHRPPNFHGPDSEWEKRYFRPPPSQRPTHLHVRAAGRANQRYALLFRDYLRAHPATADGYAELKRRLATYCVDDRASYSDIKDPACDIIMAAAADWARSTGWQLGPSDA